MPAKLERPGRRIGLRVPPVATGLDLLVASAPQAEDVLRVLRGRRVGLLLNQASVDASLRHAIDLLVGRPDFSVGALFGPQHGIWGTTQDNMVEWEGFHDPRLDLPVYSLYGEHRKPPLHTLDGLDAMLVDLFDVGARYYTFLWTATLVMEACAERGIPLCVLDRPNPLNGVDLEGPFAEPAFASFVGRFPVAVRHGMTMGELLTMFNQTEQIGCDLHVVRIAGWERRQWFTDTGLPWVMPSPNMPTLDTAIVYPGMCMVEGTDVSEGRGTTRPFEIVGAPWVDGVDLARALDAEELPGVIFRPLQFEPTFQKHARQTCGGVAIHVVDRDSFRSVQMAVALFVALRRLYGGSFSWKQPPYEYEAVKMPIDILAGSTRLRSQIDGGVAASRIVASWAEDLRVFEAMRREFLLYR